MPGAPVPPRTMMPAAPYGMYPQGARPPAKQSSMARTLLLIAMVAVVAVLAIIIIKVATASPDNPPPQPPVPPTTTATTPEPTPTPTETTPPPPPQPQWANDDYQVPEPNLDPPPLPEGQTYGDAEDWMQANALYGEPVPVPVRCEIPTDIDPSTASVEELKTYLNDEVECLMRIWGPALEAAGFTASRPPVNIYLSAIQSPCGKLPLQNAVFCPANQQIYYNPQITDSFPEYKHDAVAIAAVIAHEFGHAVQARSGISWGRWVWVAYYEDNKDQPKVLNLKRRSEAQADCMAGVFVQSVTLALNIPQEEIDNNIAKMFYLMGDDVITGKPNIVGDHGLGNNRKAWFLRGTKTPTVSTCNAFSLDVPDDQVR